MECLPSPVTVAADRCDGYRIGLYPRGLGGFSCNHPDCATPGAVCHPLPEMGGRA
jgi:hypothetical protein